MKLHLPDEVTSAMKMPHQVFRMACLGEASPAAEEAFKQDLGLDELYDALKYGLIASAAYCSTKDKVRHCSLPCSIWAAAGCDTVLVVWVPANKHRSAFSLEHAATRYCFPGAAGGIVQGTPDRLPSNCSCHAVLLLQVRAKLQAFRGGELADASFMMVEEKREPWKLLQHSSSDHPCKI
jgi:hypothetical protein